jgi:hypothetical protein
VVLLTAAAVVVVVVVVVLTVRQEQNLSKILWETFLSTVSLTVLFAIKKHNVDTMTVVTRTDAVQG